MKQFSTTIIYSLIGFIVLALLGLGVWYYFLHSRTQNLSPVLSNGEVPVAPFGDTGSTYQNVASGVGINPTVGGNGGVIASTTSGGASGGNGGKNQRLWQVSKTPTAGFGFGTTTKVRFVERATGYVFEADPKTATISRLTNTLVPKTLEAIIGPNAIITRSLSASGGIASFYDTIVIATTSPVRDNPPEAIVESQARASNGASAPGSLVQKPLPIGILSLALNLSGKEIVYILQNAGGGATVYRAKADGTKPTQLFDSPLVGWRLRILSDNRIILTQNATEEAPGYSYELNGGALSPIIGNILGLTVLPRASSGALLYGQSAGQLTLFARADAAAPAKALSIHTIADKCVWDVSKPPRGTKKQPDLIAYCAVPQSLPGGNFLDLWYRGAIHTSDAWLKIDITTSSSTQLLTPDPRTPLDVENPVMDPTDNYIVFTNAADKSLWSLRIAT